MKRQISVFIASPGDLTEERKQFRETINLLNIGFGDGANVEFIPLGWEDALASTGRRTQGVINEEIDRCNVFILLMYRRWGQEAPDAKPYSSYTEEEFHRALEHWKKDGTPEVFVFFKRVDPESEADPGLQLQKVLAFRRQLEETRLVLYHYFDSIKSFANEVDRHLRAYAKDELPKADQKRDMVLLPLEAISKVENAKIVAEKKAEEADKTLDTAEKSRLKIEAIQLQIAEDAASLSKEGKVEFARQKFSELVTETVDIRILYLGYEFFERTGDMNSAISVLRKWLNLSGPDKISIDTADAYGNLANLYQTQGELYLAEEMYQKSLALHEILSSKEGMASTYSNLGNLYQIRGEFERSEEMYQKSLAINDLIGRKERMANQFGNLGNLYQIRGELDLAEEMYKQSLAIYEAFGNKEGIANQFGNLGNLYQIRGKLDLAEGMYQKSLVINEELDRKEGMANQFGNLGILYQTKGELERAEEMYKKSLAINEALGRKEGMANQFGNLGNLYQNRGELDLAKEMYQKSSVINDALGRKEGMAKDYGNLGNLFQIRGEFGQAADMYQKSLAINIAIGCKGGIADDYGNFANLYQVRGDLDLAEDMYEKSLVINKELDRKESIANQFSNLGILYQTKGELERAEEMYKKSMQLYIELGSPQIPRITKLLMEIRK